AALEPMCCLIRTPGLRPPAGRKLLDTTSVSADRRAHRGARRDRADGPVGNKLGDAGWKPAELARSFSAKEETYEDGKASIARRHDGGAARVVPGRRPATGRASAAANPLRHAHQPRAGQEGRGSRRGRIEEEPMEHGDRRPGYGRPPGHAG